MSMYFQEHHFKNLGRARDHLSETMLSLQSAIERMTRDARVQSIGGGATEVMLDEVAKRL